MNVRCALGVALPTAVVIGAILVAGPAQASTQEYVESSAMARVVADDGGVSASSRDAEPRRIVGVAKALASGFKAANAPKAVADAACLASILGSAAEAPLGSHAVEAAYFDR